MKRFKELREALSTRYARNTSKKEMDAVRKGIEQRGVVLKSREQHQPTYEVERSQGEYEARVYDDKGKYEVIGKFKTASKAYDAIDKLKIKTRNK